MKESINTLKVKQCREVWFDKGGCHCGHAGVEKETGK